MGLSVLSFLSFGELSWGLCFFRHDCLDLYGMYVNRKALIPLVRSHNTIERG